MMLRSLGKGFQENLHAHSCKSRSWMVQFGHDQEKRWIIRLWSLTRMGKSKIMNCAEKYDILRIKLK